MAADSAPPSAASSEEREYVWYCLLEEGRPQPRAAAAAAASRRLSRHSPSSNRACATAFRWSGILACLAMQLFMLKLGVLTDNVHNTGDLLLGVLDLLLCFTAPAIGFTYAAQLDHMAKGQERLAGPNQTA